MWGIVGDYGGKCVILYRKETRIQEMRLLGNIEAKTDTKGRVFLPASFRKVLQASGEEYLILRKDVYQTCLVLYPEKVWNEQMDGLRSRLNRWNPAHQQLFRQYLYDVEMITPDSSGRILIPRKYLESAGISQNIRFIGMGDYIEIWSSDQTEKSFISQEDFTKALEELMSQPGNHSFHDHTETR